LGYDADGSGEHALLWVEKRGANTDWVARELAKFAGVPPLAVGYAGLKDRHAVTRQQRALRRRPRQAFQCREAVDRGQLANRIHPGVEVERRQACSGIANFGQSQADLVAHLGERVRGHPLPPSI